MTNDKAKSLLIAGAKASSSSLVTVKRDQLLQALEQPGKETQKPKKQVGATVKE